jgi:cyclophilin family peptidyl-prolyl cis-trans isomerase
MATIGVKTNGSQFYISLAPSPWLNGRCPVFGRLTNKSDELLKQIEKVFAVRGSPLMDIVIKKCDVSLPEGFQPWKDDKIYLKQNYEI